jgi:hypothetical protein
VEGAVTYKPPTAEERANSIAGECQLHDVRPDNSLCYCSHCRIYWEALDEIRAAEQVARKPLERQLSEMAGLYAKSEREVERLRETNESAAVCQKHVNQFARDGCLVCDAEAARPRWVQSPSYSSLSPGGVMTWLEYHRESERLAAEAETATRRGDTDQARELYKEAAEAEELALQDLEPSKSRTLGISAVSAVSLYFKASTLAAAESVAYRLLTSEHLPEFAADQLRGLLQSIWSEKVRALDEGDKDV